MSERNHFLIAFLSFWLTTASVSQEIKIFTVSDFDLKGEVNKSLVITDYGKEEYHFNQKGLLTKAITRFSDTDFETTYYKYNQGELIEKRVEHYRDDIFDKATSLAYFYEVDTTSNRKVTEKIITYTKELLEKNVYNYDALGNLTEVTSTDANGTDKSQVRRDTMDSHITRSRIKNDRLEESVEKWTEATEEGTILEHKRTISYLDEIPDTRKKEVFGPDGKLLSYAESIYDASTETWISQFEDTHSYSENGMLEKTITKRRNALSAKEYIYQFDGTEANNWVKEIVTPDNTYRTRKISYYLTPQVANETSEGKTPEPEEE